MKRHVKGNVSWVGYLDWELENFHGDDYSIFHGSSQNAYLIEEEKTILVDTVWAPHRFDFIENLKREIMKLRIENERLKKSYSVETTPDGAKVFRRLREKSTKS